MKLDFLKKGLVNTANFIPSYAIGEINMHPMALGVNLLGRLLSIYLCFQFNAEIDPKSLILAVLFPALYIMYIIADKGIDDVLGKFDLEVTDFTEVFDSDNEKCVERKGKNGDLKSVPEDKARCEAVIGGRRDSRMKCDEITTSSSPIRSDKIARENAGICKYIGGEDTLRCSEFKYPETCETSGYDCTWTNYDTDDDPDKYRTFCKDYSEKENVALTDCPSVCPFYLKGQPNFIVKKTIENTAADSYNHIQLMTNNPDAGPTAKTYTLLEYAKHDADSPGFSTSANTATERSSTGFYRYSGSHVSNDALIAVQFDSSNETNQFYPLFSTDYRDSDIQLRFQNSMGSTVRTLRGKVVIIMNSALVAIAEVSNGLTEEVQRGGDTGGTATPSNVSIYGPPIKINSGSRRSGTYTVVIKPTDLKGFYDDYIDPDSTNVSKGDGVQNIYGGINQNNTYQIQAVIFDETTETSHCGKIWGDKNQPNWNDPTTATTPGSGVDYSSDMLLSWHHWKNKANRHAVSSSTDNFDVSGVAFNGQLLGTCSN